MLRRIKGLLIALLLVHAVFAPSVLAEEGQKQAYADPPMPAFRINADGFGEASKADIRALLVSTGRELWRWFPEYEVEPFVVTRGRKGPIVLYNRNDRGEIVMRLDTQGLSWSQYAYQFAHEFCHILCGFDEDDCPNEWFEETLCETASLYAMRAMAKSWEHDAPYRNWVEYRHALKQYADDVIDSREQLKPEEVAAFFKKHQAKLEESSTLRDLNGAMSVVLLAMFEEDPKRWEAVRWLNPSPNKDGQTFTQYLQAWHDAAPKRHQSFIREVAELYGIKPLKADQ